MPIQNSDIVAFFNEMADLLEIQGANEFRIRAYRNAARTIGNWSHNLFDLIDSPKNLKDIPGIGENMAEKIQEIVKTGSLKQLEKLKRKTDPELSELLNLEGLGPKKVKALYDALGITNLKSLKAAAEQHEIRELSGFGTKTEENILSEVNRYQGKEKRFHLMEAEQRAKPLVKYLKQTDGVQQVIVAGSFRRRRRP